MAPTGQASAATTISPSEAPEASITVDTPPEIAKTPSAALTQALVAMHRARLTTISNAIGRL